LRYPGPGSRGFARASANTAKLRAVCQGVLRVRRE
jgi:hypothetical protein